jgi:hypothetical protein
VDVSRGPDLTAVTSTLGARRVSWPPGPARPALDPQAFAAMIAEAMAAGRVTVCPPGYAAGLTRLEQQFMAVPAPRPSGDAARQKRAGRGCALTLAGRVRA